MDKIPVGRSIARAYGFLFGRIFTIVGLSWVGALLYGALTLVLMQKMGTVTVATVTADPQIAALHLACVIGAALLIAGIVIPLTREALGQGGERVIAHLVIGAREIRYLFALLRLYVLLIVLVAGGVFAVTRVPMAVQMAMAQWPQLAQYPVLQAAQVGTIVLTVALVLFAMLRFGFLLAPVAAVESHASLRQAWSLSRGNTWRMLIVMLGVLIPAYALLFAGEYALLGQPILDAYRNLFAAWPGDPGALLNLFAGHSEVLAAVAGIKLVVVFSLSAGASAVAYRVLTGTDEDAPHMSEAAAHGDGHDHGHDAHGHDDHGHDAHGHDAHGHDAHGHDEHGHGAHGHDDHGHGDHGHDEHGHGGHGHHAAHAEEHPAHHHEERRVLEHA